MKYSKEAIKTLTYGDETSFKKTKNKKKYLSYIVLFQSPGILKADIQDEQNDAASGVIYPIQCHVFK